MTLGQPEAARADIHDRRRAPRSTGRTRARGIRMIRLTPFGGASEIGGSCLLLEAFGAAVVVDCGMRPKADAGKYPDLDRLADIATPDALLVTHAHIDHTGALPLFHRRALDGAEEHDAGVVDEGVEPAEFLDGSVDGGLGLGLVRDVGLVHEHASACLPYLASQLFQAIGAPSSERDRSACCGEGMSGSGADAAACSCYECNGSVESFVHQVFLRCMLMLRTTLYMHVARRCYSSAMNG